MLFILGSRPASMWFGFGRYSGDEGTWLDQLFYFTIIILSVGYAYSRRVNWQKLFTANLAITLFYIYFGISAVWSADPSGSFKRWLKLVGIIFAVSVVLSEAAPLDAMRGVYARCASALFPLSIVFIKYFPELGRDYGKGGGEPMLTGASTQKNTLGEMTLVLTLFLLWGCFESVAPSRKTKGLLAQLPWNRVVLVLMGIYVLIISQSKTSLMCLLIGVVLMLGRRFLTSRLTSTAILFVALSLPGLLFLTQEFTSVFSPLFGILGRDATLTGRTGIWQHIGLSTVNSLIGDGYFSFWGTGGGQALRVAMDDMGVHSAHDGYLDIYLDGGLIGVGLLFCLLLANGKRIIANLRSDSDLKSPMSRFHGLKFAFLILFIVYNLSESTFARLASTWFTAMLLFLELKQNKVNL